MGLLPEDESARIWLAMPAEHEPSPVGVSCTPTVATIVEAVMAPDRDFRLDTWIKPSTVLYVMYWVQVGPFKQILLLDGMVTTLVSKLSMVMDCV